MKKIIYIFMLLTAIAMVGCDVDISDYMKKSDVEKLIGDTKKGIKKNADAIKENAKEILDNKIRLGKSFAAFTKDFNRVSKDILKVSDYANANISSIDRLKSTVESFKVDNAEFAEDIKKFDTKVQATYSIFDAQLSELTKALHSMYLPLFAGNKRDIQKLKKDFETLQKNIVTFKASLAKLIEQLKNDIDKIPAGTKGDKGDKGDKGERGERGRAGATGHTGAQGEQGADGVDGVDGADGADGVDGVNGASYEPSPVEEQKSDLQQKLDEVLSRGKEATRESYWARAQKEFNRLVAEYPNFRKPEGFSVEGYVNFNWLLAARAYKRAYSGVSYQNAITATSILAGVNPRLFEDLKTSGIQANAGVVRESQAYDQEIQDFNNALLRKISDTELENNFAKYEKKRYHRFGEDFKTWCEKRNTPSFVFTGKDEVHYGFALDHFSLSYKEINGIELNIDNPDPTAPGYEYYSVCGGEDEAQEPQSDSAVHSASYSIDARDADYSEAEMKTVDNLDVLLGNYESALSTFENAFCANQKETALAHAEGRPANISASYVRGEERAVFFKVRDTLIKFLDMTYPENTSPGKAQSIKNDLKNFQVDFSCS